MDDFLGVEVDEGCEYFLYDVFDGDQRHFPELFKEVLEVPCLCVFDHEDNSGGVVVLNQFTSEEFDYVLVSAGLSIQPHSLLGHLI